MVEIPSSFFPIGSGNSNEERKACGPNFAHGFRDLEDDADAIFEAAAKFILTEIAERRKEFMEQIAVSRVNFQDFKTGCEGALGCFAKGMNDFADLRRGERTGHGVILIKRLGAWRDGFPASLLRRNFFAAEPRRRGAAFAAGMSKLHAGEGALFADEFDDGPPGGDVRVEIDSGIYGRDAPAGFDGGGFGENKRGAAYGAAAEMDEMPGLGMAVDGGIFAHRGNDDAVF